MLTEMLDMCVPQCHTTARIITAELRRQIQDTVTDVLSKEHAINTSLGFSQFYSSYKFA